MRRTGLDAAHLGATGIRSTHTRPVTVPAAGARVELNLIANPTKVRHKPLVDGERPKGAVPRVPLPPEQRPAWLTRHLDGALTLDLPKLGGKALRGGFGNHPSGQKITFARHLYFGPATVTDTQAAARLVSAGIGPAKGYGCGLLLLREMPV